MGNTLLGKAVAAAWAAIAAYWMSMPPSYTLLIGLMGTDLVFGGLAAFRDSKFSGKRMFWGTVVKFAAFPMALLCDKIEQPLHVGFHLETGFILYVTAFEFISVVKGYAELGCPGAAFLIAVTQRVKDSLNAMAAAAVPTPMKKVENTRIEVEPTLLQPVPPPPVTITKETHSEPVAAPVAAEIKKED